MSKKENPHPFVMNLAILVTNTDESDFSNRFPKDGEKFQKLIHQVRPEWQLQVYNVKDDVFPETAGVFDGLIITGSPASVHDSYPWIAKLKRLVRDAYQAQQPIFGACFGHQLIAEALGGKVEDNPTGWVLGTVETQSTCKPDWTKHLPYPMHLYAAHKEQVVHLPESAETITTHPSCKIAGFHIGSAIYTTQYHPEMDHEFIGALTEELSESLPAEIISRSLSSLKSPADNREFAESIARFFEFSR